MSELIDHKIIDMPALWAVGAQVHVMNEGDNPLPAEWRKQFESGRLHGHNPFVAGRYELL